MDEQIINNKYFNFTNKIENKYINNEYTLKQNKFNPYKNSPNLFLSKLEFRIKNYFLEEELLNDNFDLSLQNK